LCKQVNDRLNSSGCTDITAYEAVKAVRREERRRLIAELKALANKHGYRIVSTIRLKDMDGDYRNE
jgi:hypothetical protein